MVEFTFGVIDRYTFFVFAFITKNVSFSYRNQAICKLLHFFMYVSHNTIFKSGDTMFRVIPVGFRSLLAHARRRLFFNSDQ